jgi:uncharacterized protein (TIRG00374 family)
VGRIKLVIKLAIVLGCAGLLVWLIDWRASLALLAQAAPASVGWGILLVSLAFVISAWKWQRLLAAAGVQAPLAPLVRIYWIGAFVSTFLPSVVPGDAVRVAMARRYGAPAAVTASIVVERVTGLAALLLLAAGAAAAAPSLVPGDVARTPMLIVGAAGLVALLVLLGVATGSAARRWQGGRAWEGQVRAVLARFGSSLSEVTRQPGALLVACAASFAFYGVVTLSHYVAIHAIGGEVSLADLAVVAPLVILAGALPIVPNGLGMGEGAFVLLYTQVGLTPEEALAAALLRRLIVTAVALAGGAPRLAPPIFATATGRVVEQLLADRPLRPANLLIYVSGCVCFSLGVKAFLAADLGLDPLHAMTLGIVDMVGLPQVQVGFVVSTITLALLALWSVWCKRLPPLSVFLTMALTGYLVDAWFWLSLEPWLDSTLPDGALMLLGLLLDAYGSSLIIMSGVGIRVVDLVALAFVERLGWRFMAGKMVVEAGFVAVAWLCGGPLGAATIAFLLLVGPFMEPMMWVSHRYLGLPNYGLAKAKTGCLRSLEA